LGDILANGGENLFVNDDTVQMMVKGNAGDVVNLDDQLNGTDPGDWAKATGVVEVSGVRYEVYQHSTENVELLVQEGVTTNLV
ncbi:Biofilm associated protein A, partial [Pantoea sp. Pa-EAmG]|uniref:Biofilm associated protein A n=1 Tax=Pantoea sp. Pa-EAmG TaxID=3043311 RepID=UPI0024AFD2B9